MALLLAVRRLSLRSEWPARAAQLVHAAGGIVLVAALAAHLGLVLRHALVLRDGRLRRMLPGRD